MTDETHSERLPNRTRERQFVRGLLLVGAAIVGIRLASVHWLGIVIGGALVGLLGSTVRRALLLGAFFGLVVWLVFVGSMALDGVVGQFRALADFAALSFAIAVGLGTFGSLARGLR